MEFEEIGKKLEILQKRQNDTPEKIFEYEFYAWMWHLLDTIYAFETENRVPLREVDYREMLGELDRVYKEIKGNIEYLERNRKK